MTLSLNEVDALAKKATRGAGYPWGVAEEAGKAVRWLCAADIDGCAALANVLADAPSDLAARAPRLGPVWTAASGQLCPLLAGMALSDFADTLDDKETSLRAVACPILLAPFAGLAAQCLETPVMLAWDDATIRTDGLLVDISGNIMTMAANVSVTHGPGAAPQTPRPQMSRARPDPDTLAALDQLAHRTYAPATEASRLKGAGAGLSDND